MNQVNEIIFLSPLSALGRRARLAKMTSFFLANGFQIKFFGWERLKNELVQNRWDDERVKEHAILRGGGYTSSKARAMYPLWMLAVFFKTLRLGRGRIFLCLGWETAFPAVLAGLLTGSIVIFDDADRFSLIVKLPPLVRRFVQGLERWVSGKSRLHIVPGFSRYEWKGENMQVLKNTPSVADFEDARRVAVPRPNAQLVLYSNGWVGDTRGASIFLAVMQHFQKSNLDVVMHIAGRVDSADGEALIKQPNVIFYGELPQREALAIYAASDVVLTYYDPRIEINKDAESNKWGDCIYFGKPFVVNKEVRTAEFFVDSGAAWSVPYADVEGLINLLSQLANDRRLIESASRRLSGMEESYPNFDIQMERLISSWN